MEKITWQAHEYIYTEKNTDWYWIVAIVTLSISIISILLSNIIFAILIIISAGTLTLFSSRKPELIHIEINQKSIIIGSIKYPFENLDSFWVEKNIGHERVILKSKKILMPFISVLIQGVSPEEVQKILLHHLPEEEQTESLLEKFLIYLGF